MDQKLEDFLKRIVADSTAGAGGQTSRPTVKGFALPRHGADKNAINKYLMVGADRRQDAIVRLLGLRDFKTHEITTIGTKYLSECVNKYRIIINQFKKWHFINPINNRDKEAQDFSVYPYWVLLEFMCSAKELMGSVEITPNEFLIFITSIKKREDIAIHVEAYRIAKSSKNNYDDFMSKIPKDTSAKFVGGHWNQVLESGFFEYIEYLSDREIIRLTSNVKCEDIQSMLESFYRDFIFLNYNSKEYKAFLQEHTGDKMIFPDANITQVDIKNVSENINNNFEQKNILLKGVPGTGKSTLLSNIVERKIFKLKNPTLDKKGNPCLSVSNLIRNNVLRINIHSASTNSELMQGIGIGTDNQSRIIYSEKRGLILKHIEKACFHPTLPFVLILEEIQENSLNELIGDLIYLIETTKRAKIQEVEAFDTSGHTFGSLVDYYIEHITNIHYVELPSLIDPDKTQKMIIPDNLYIFCTSNYRDDKKVIEDNLLRRFSVIELYPQYQSDLGRGVDGEFIFKSEDVSKFLFDINKEILKLFDKEMHADRFLIGQSNWLQIVDEKDVNLFYEALLKVFIEFKEIKELEFQGSVDELLIFICENKSKYGEWIEGALQILCHSDKSISDYKSVVTLLQNEIYKDVFSANNLSDKIDVEISQE